MSQPATKQPSKLRSVRKGRGWSQEELEARSGVAQERISRLERQEPPPAIRNAILVAKALGTTVEALFGEPESLNSTAVSARTG